MATHLRRLATESNANHEAQIIFGEIDQFRSRYILPQKLPSRLLEKNGFDNIMSSQIIDLKFENTYIELIKKERDAARTKKTQLSFERDTVDRKCASLRGSLAAMEGRLTAMMTSMATSTTVAVDITDPKIVETVEDVIRHEKQILNLRYLLQKRTPSNIAVIEDLEKRIIAHKTRYDQLQNERTEIIKYSRIRQPCIYETYDAAREAFTLASIKWHDTSTETAITLARASIEKRRMCMLLQVDPASAITALENRANYVKMKEEHLKSIAVGHI